MKKTFVTNLALLMSVNLLIKPFWILGIDRGVQNTLGYSTYGMYANLYVFGYLFVTLLDLGINSFASTQIAKNKNNLQKYFGALFLFKVLSSVIYIVVTLSLGKIYGYDNGRIYLLFFIGVNQILSYFYLFFRSAVGGLQLFKTDSLLSVIDRVLMIILCSLMLWTSVFSLSLQSFIYAQTVSYLFASLLAFSFIKPHLSFVKFKINWLDLKEVLKKMMPYAALSLLMTFYSKLDNILLQKLTPDGDFHNGVYASAYRLLEAANMMAVLVSMLLLPIFSKMIEGRQNLNPLVNLVTSIMVFPAIIIAISCYLYQDNIMLALYPQSTTYGASTFGLVIFCFVAYAIMYVYGTLLTANGSLKILNLLALIALVGNLVLNYWLIPKYLAYGAAIAAVVTQFFIALTNGYYGIKQLKIQFENNYVGSFLTAVLLIIMLSFIVRYFVDAWFLGIIINCLGGLIIMLLFNLLDTKQAIRLLKGQIKE